MEFTVDIRNHCALLNTSILSAQLKEKRKHNEEG